MQAPNLCDTFTISSRLVPYNNIKFSGFILLLSLRVLKALKVSLLVRTAGQTTEIQLVTDLPKIMSFQNCLGYDMIYDSSKYLPVVNTFLLVTLYFITVLLFVYKQFYIYLFIQQLSVYKLNCTFTCTVEQGKVAPGQSQEFKRSKRGSVLRYYEDNEQSSSYF